MKATINVSVSTLVFTIWLVLLTGFVLYKTTPNQLSITENLSLTDGAGLEQAVFNTIQNKPEIIQQAMMAAQQRQQEIQAKQLEEAKVYFKAHKREILGNPDLPMAGNPKGDVTIGKFFDYKCGHCNHLSGAVEELIGQDPNLKVVFFEFPIFPGSDVYAKGALAAHKQGKYWAFHRALMEAGNNLQRADMVKIAEKLGLNKAKFEKDIDSPEMEKMLVENRELGAKLSVRGTPMLLVGDDLIPGALPTEILKQKIKDLR